MFIRRVVGGFKGLRVSKLNHPKRKEEKGARSFYGLSARMRDRSLPFEARALFALLDSFANKHGEVIISIERMAEYTGWHRRTVIKYLDILRDQAPLEKTKQTGWHKQDHGPNAWIAKGALHGRCNAYVLIYPLKPAKD